MIGIDDWLEAAYEDRTHLPDEDEYDWPEDDEDDD